ncbi:signal-transducing adaptor protein 1-like isoform X2 [Hypomesus transpacificus]|uniref:signal-transducing adaptor protein 1-like isoform X2 n=1 Tax=Hypomesus transpacificus TaxID=137520 RepID=UPI001F075791|nr:signal-transducing adaptor protein 1-like isoform X2 [Hypomesus transpacificus]
MAIPRRAGRLRTQLPNCYYEGYLEKRSFKDKTSQKLWTCLCENTLFFFNTNKDNDYVDKLALTDFISLTDDCNRDKNLGAARLNLHMKNENFKLTAPSLEARELWKGYIYSVVELAVPCSLNLLPGQIYLLRETVERERERLRTASSPPSQSNPDLYVSLLSEMPSCFQRVSRSEAENILEKHRGKGNLLLRPNRDGASFAVTTYQDLNGPVFRHYRVTKKHDGHFAIDIDNPIPCATLHDVVNCLVDKTSGVLTPLILEAPYEGSITFVQSNEENGERSLHCASSSPIPPAFTSNSETESASPPAPDSPPDSAPASPPDSTLTLPPRPGPRDQNYYEEEDESETGESLYLNNPHVKEEEPAPPFPPRSRLPILKTPVPVHSSLPGDTIPARKALKPPSMHPGSRTSTPLSRPTFAPTPTPRTTPWPSLSAPTSRSHSLPDIPEARLRTLTAGRLGPPILPGLSEELRAKLEKRRVVE